MSKRHVTYAGHSAVLVEFDNTTVAIDPWLQGNPLCPPSLHNPNKLDIIILTHGHADHAGDAIRLQRATGAKVVATYELAMILIAEGVPSGNVIPMNKGGVVKANGVSIHLTHAYHSSSYDTANGPRYAGEACSVILSGYGATLFHAGDTALFSDLKLIGDTYQPDMAFLPIGDRFTMGPREAALAASWLKCKTAVPIHYKTFDLLTGTYTEFASECEKLKVVSKEMAPGESLSF